MIVGNDQSLVIPHLPQSRWGRTAQGPSVTPYPFKRGTDQRGRQNGFGPLRLDLITAIGLDRSEGPEAVYGPPAARQSGRPDNGVLERNNSGNPRWMCRIDPIPGGGMGEELSLPNSSIGGTGHSGQCDHPAQGCGPGIHAGIGGIGPFSRPVVLETVIQSRKEVKPKFLMGKDRLEQPVHPGTPTRGHPVDF